MSPEKHIAYAEHVVALDEQSRIKAAGSAQEVAAALGITVVKADAQMNNEKVPVETPPNPAEALLATLAPPPVDDEFTEPARRLGAPGTFRQYGRSAGWSTVAVVMLSLAVYAFSGSFPSGYILTLLSWWRRD